MEEHAPPRWPNVNAPPGYRFKPTPRELIQCYLEPGHQSPGEFYGIMAAADVYGEDPGTLASRFQHIAHDDGNWYFLSVARWKDGNARSKRMNRAVGALGTWHGSGKRIPVRGAGYRQSFEFRPAGGGKTAWLMEEFGTVRNDATGEDGVKVLCRLHLRPKAAAVADGDDRQQQLEANDVPVPCNKRQRQRAPARQTAAPDVGGSSSYYATTAAAPAPAPPDVSRSIGHWQHQPMMEQVDGDCQYHCAGVHGGVYIRADDEPQRLEMVTEDLEFTAQDLKLEDSDFVFTVEHLLQLDDGWIMDSNSNAFSVLQTMCDGVQENNDPKPEPSDGVQENDDDDPKGDTDAS
ncbi:unnamed protein product [Miscanthus lutarioriparius]|uniref:NAC domain-containing protein n=1 Tax=Miscanthus lutarioriparius TaxID=422564 RepID=A0A811QHC1_9POAL|nr:unnamed protein product [Miscanthus lutarioriparius]